MCIFISTKIIIHLGHKINSIECTPVSTISQLIGPTIAFQPETPIALLALGVEIFIGFQNALEIILIEFELSFWKLF